MKHLRLFAGLCVVCGLTACTTTGKSYENKVFPTGKWQPVNQQQGAWQ